MTKQKKRDEKQQEELDRTLQEQGREDMLGQMEENRNLTGSTTWETLEEKYNDENQQHGRRTQAASPREQQNLRGQSSRSAERRQEEEERRASEGVTSDEERRARQAANPPRTTTGPVTAPKFGSAGSGGAELEPGPEKD
ncbi:MAG TPA: hypothetical protein VF041_07910 [Gemmatimonadaceae bacterium]